jgi:dimethylhistidine N-methyltransferase
MSQAEVNFIDFHPDTARLQEEVLDGLCDANKTIAPKFFYDHRGSRLFDAICDTPEYYPTRTEINILNNCINELAEHIDDEVMLIELGSGASRKIRILMDNLQPAAYMGIDISRDFLLQQSYELAADYPEVEVHAVCADLCEPLQLDGIEQGSCRLAYFPGSSIGNFEPQQAVEFMNNLHSILDKRDRFLVGVDLKKDKNVLHAAYNDAQGTTAEFNLNVLHRIRRELDAELDPDNFSHLAFYNNELGRIEMHLVSDIDQAIRIEEEIIQLQEGERIHTECSYKYDIDEFQQLASSAGFNPLTVWTDSRHLFSLHLLQPSE